MTKKADRIPTVRFTHFGFWVKDLKKMGDFWFEQYGDAVVSLLLGQYQGPSLDAVNPETGRPG